MIILVAAIANNLALGKNNAMLWHLPNDFKHFKALTSHQTIVMGRKTFESLPGVLPNRKHIIITRNKAYKVPENCLTAPSLENVIQNQGSENLFIIGGGEIYRQALPFADKIELTRVNYTFAEADTFFPEINFSEWIIVTTEKHYKDEKHAYDYEFITLVRKQD